MRIKTINQINIPDKPRVFFAANPIDFAQYFETLSDEILSIKDCAVYYYESDVDIRTRDWKEDLLEMNLIAIPVTDMFLRDQSIYMDIYLFSQDQKIPLLPIMVEEGLSEKFNQICGHKQFLDRTIDDLTSLPYLKKLEDFLSIVLFDDDVLKKVRASFDAQIFVGYRQMDRKHVHRMMKVIHSNEFAEGVAIWYDEFLQPDENFDDSIRNAIMKSNLFILAITPNLVRESNYVVTDEYPTAVKAQKAILPVELKDTEKKLLRDTFPGIPKSINIDDTDSLTEELKRLLPHDAERPLPDGAEHKFFIGLAYLFGINVEVDREKAVNLISSAAECGVIEAARYLVKMYYFGFYVHIDFSKAIYWQKKLALYLREQNENSPSVKTALDFADELRFLTEIERNCTSVKYHIDEMIAYCRAALVICEDVKPTDEEELSRYAESKLNTLRSLAILYEMTENYDEALDAYYESLEMRKVLIKADESLNDERVKVLNKVRLAQLYQDIGTLYLKKDDHYSAIEAYLNSIKIYALLSEVTQDLLPYEADAHRELSMAAVFDDIPLANKHSALALDICKKLVEKNASLYELRYASALLNRAYILTESCSSDFDEIKSLCHEAEKIYEHYHISDSYEIGFNFMNVLYKLAGAYRKTVNLDRAGQYYDKAESVALKLLNGALPQDELTFAHFFFDYGTFLVLDVNKDNLTKSDELLRKALSMYERLGTKGQPFVDETKRCLASLRDAGESVNSEKEVNAIHNEILKVFGFFNDFLARGAKAADTGNYQKAFIAYKSALEQLLILEKLNGEVDNLGKVGLFYELAYCCEMNQDLSGAKMYYMKIVELTYKKVKGTCDIDETDEALYYFYLDKAVSYFDICGYPEGIAEYIEKLSKM